MSHYSPKREGGWLAALAAVEVSAADFRTDIEKVSLC